MIAERALSVQQPWADLILHGGKDVENRTRRFPSTLDLPVRIGIHASKATADVGWAWFQWGRLTPFDIPMPAERRGALLGYVTVTGCHHAGECYAQGHLPDDPVCTCAGMPEYGHEPGCGYEPYCSDWAEPDAWHWTLDDPEPLHTPVPMRGMLGLWTLPETP